MMLKALRVSFIRHTVGVALQMTMISIRRKCVVPAEEDEDLVKNYTNKHRARLIYLV